MYKFKCGQFPSKEIKKHSSGLFKIHFTKTLGFQFFFFFFTDGSKDKVLGSGAGVYCFLPHIEASFKLPKEFQIYSCESYAILKALEMIDLHQLRKSVIFTGSYSVLQSLNKQGLNSKMSPLLAFIRERIYKLTSTDKIIKLIWIPSHKNIAGNDKADYLAKQALLKEIEETEKCWFSELFHEVNKNMLKQNIDFFANYNKGAKYCSLAPPFSMSQWFDGVNMSRRELVTLNRVRSAHSLNA